MKIRLPLVDYAASSWGVHLREQYSSLTEPKNALSDSSLLEESKIEKEMQKPIAFVKDKEKVSDPVVHMFSGRFDTLNPRGQISGLHVAAYLNLVRVAEILVAEGMDVKCRDRAGGTPLH